MKTKTQEKTQAVDCGCVVFDDGRTMGIRPCADHNQNHSHFMAPAPQDATYRAAIGSAYRAMAMQAAAQTRAMVA